VAHLKLAMQLAAQDLDKSQRNKWACDLSGNGRLGIYLTNALEEIDPQLKIPLYGPLRVIAEEGKAADKIKHQFPIMVILGNPPYSGHSANRSWEIKEGKRVPTFIGELLQDYYFVDGKKLDERNPKWLQDDYVKFIRWSQWRIEKTGSGILGFITNHGYLDNPTFRGMRQCLMKSFTDIYILDLHGNTRKKERCPDGSKDDPVFDIQQGVAIGIFVKEGGKKGPAKVNHANLWGLRDYKDEQLLKEDVNKTKWQEIQPTSPFYLFIPQDTKLLPEYQQGWKITEIFPVHNVGIITKRDSLTIHWTKEDIWETVNDFVALPPGEAREKYNLPKDVRDWKIEWAQRDLQESALSKDKIMPVLYRPFDVRFTYYTGKSRGFLGWPFEKIMRNMLIGENIALITSRLTKGEAFKHAQVTKNIPEVICMSSKTSNNGFIFPLYLYQDVNKKKGQQNLLDSSLWPAGKDGRTPNLNPKFIEDLEKQIKIKFVSDGSGDLKKTFGPEDILHYIYAIFHSQTYRDRYAQFLKGDFPRVPLTSNRGLFRKLCGLGKELTSLHLMTSKSLQSLITRYPVTGDNQVDKGYPKYFAPGQPEPSTKKPLKQGRVYIRASQYFEGVPEEVWNFAVGGYQVCEKWLKDRRGRQLSYDERVHYQKIIVAINETIQLMDKIDEVIPGWPIQ
jgi:predicted helicase